MFNFITTLPLNCSEQRWRDFLFCLNKNCSHPSIKNVYLLADLLGTKDNPKLCDRLSYLSTLNKIQVKIIMGRPTFKDIFAFCNNMPGTWILSNADIYFPHSNAKSLNLLLNQDYSKECFVLSRYNSAPSREKAHEECSIEIEGATYDLQHCGTKRPGLEGSSIDSWIFDAPFDFSQINLNIELGQPSCDGMMNHELSKIRRVSNPCFSIISIHKHTNWRNWYKIVNCNGEQVTLEKYVALMRSKGFMRKSIEFTKLPEDL